MMRRIATAPVLAFLASIASVATSAALPGVAQTTGAAETTLPAWEAFKKVDASIKDYTETVSAHEVKDGKTEDRVYHFAFAKPTSARSDIVSGAGAGGAAVWTGGAKLRGHKGGFLKMFTLTLPVDDPRATDLRGKTIDAAFFPTMIASFETGGKLSEDAGPSVAGTATDAVSFVPADPTKYRGLTKDVLLIARTTHLPIEHLGYEGTLVVEDEHFTDQKINPDLPPSTFTL